MRPQVIAPLVVLALLGSVSPATAQEKKEINYAFLVACSEYRAGQFQKLPYALKETEEFRQALLLTGFEDKNIVFLNDQRIAQPPSNSIPNLQMPSSIEAPHIFSAGRIMKRQSPITRQSLHSIPKTDALMTCEVIPITFI
jgi:hypothetical protein